MASGGRRAGCLRDLAAPRQAVTARCCRTTRTEPPKLLKGEAGYSMPLRTGGAGCASCAPICIASGPRRFRSLYAKAQMRATDRGTGDAGCAIGVASRGVRRPG